MGDQSPLKVAILDMNNNHPNQGLRCIREIVDKYPVNLEWKIFDVRHKFEIPDSSYDIYIGSGGPDSPLSEGTGERLFLQLLDELWELNQSGKEQKKSFLFICHSFQLACRYFNLAEIRERKSQAFGIFPIHKTEGVQDPILDKLPDPFYAMDFRDWQIVGANQARFNEIGAEVLLREKPRPHVDLERAIMGIRFSPEWVGFQFHPEADPDGIASYFKETKKKTSVIDTHGKEKYNAILDGLNDPNKIPLTYETVIPTFLQDSIEKLKPQAELI